MQIDLILKIAGLGLLVGVVNQLLIKADKAEQAVLASIAGLVVALMLLLPQIGALFNMIKSLFGF